MTPNANFTLNSAFAQVHLDFLRGFFENICDKNNKDRPTPSAAKMFSVDSSFWRFKVYADILRRF